MASLASILAEGLTPRTTGVKPLTVLDVDQQAADVQAQQAQARRLATQAQQEEFKRQQQLRGQQVFQQVFSAPDFDTANPKSTAFKMIKLGAPPEMVQDWVTSTAQADAFAAQADENRLQAANLQRGQVESGLQAVMDTKDPLAKHDLWDKVRALDPSLPEQFPGDEVLPGLINYNKAVGYPLRERAAAVEADLKKAEARERGAEAAFAEFRLDAVKKMTPESLVETIDRIANPTERPELNQRGKAQIDGILKLGLKDPSAAIKSVLDDVAGEISAEKRSPLYPVAGNEGIDYLNRRDAEGKSVPRTIYDARGNPSTGGVTGASLNRPDPIPASTQEQLAGFKNSIDQFKDVGTLLADPKFKTLGPVMGRVKMFEIEKLGGMGASKEEIQLAVTLRTLMQTQAFQNGGKQLTGTEKEEFIFNTPSLNDTLEQAVIKTVVASRILQRNMGTRIKVLSPSQRRQLHPDVLSAGGVEVPIEDRGDKQANPMAAESPAAPGAAAKPAAESELPVGTIRKGRDGDFRFKGGKIKDKNNWELVQPPSQPKAETPASVQSSSIPTAIQGDTADSPTTSRGIVSPSGISRIKKSEGFSPSQYEDRGKAIGYGHHGPNLPEKITEQEAHSLLVADLKPIQKFIADTVKPDLTQDQTDALASFGYNLGLGPLGKIINILNEKGPDTAGLEMLRYTNFNGNPLPGLIARRKEEAQLLKGKK